MFKIAKLLISGPHRSAGKTTVTAGICGALKKRGVIVQPFKKGPDYIDPMWLSQSAGRECRNLDFYMMGAINILRSFQSAAKGADIAVTEGSLGLFDGLNEDGTDSTAELAKLTGSRVILVIDSTRMNRGVAPLILGQINFDNDLEISGVILNKVASSRHETKLLAAIKRYVGIEVLGVIPKMPETLGVEERHLGLIPLKEDNALKKKVEKMVEIAEKNINLNRVLEISRSAPPMEVVKPLHLKTRPATVKIGIAMDRAFTFYYPDNIEALEAEGAKVIPFSPMATKKLPNVNALYIGGGFPEIFISELEANISLRKQIKTAIANGLPVYAECGGLMYLARSITYNGLKKDMVAALPLDIEMTKKPTGLGYMTLESTGEAKWFTPEGELHCHEFHHSKAVNLEKNIQFAWKTLRGFGITGKRDGIIYKNVLASYAHLHCCAVETWARDFIKLAKDTGVSTAKKFQDDLIRNKR